jgi:hypothetical protein
VQVRAFSSDFTALARLTCQSRSDIALRKGLTFADLAKCDGRGPARLAADGHRTVAEPYRDDRQLSSDRPGTLAERKKLAGRHVRFLADRYGFELR